MVKNTFLNLNKMAKDDGVDISTLNSREPEFVYNAEAENDVDIEVIKDDKNKVWTKKSIYRAWLLICYATGPVASMARTYVPATIQSISIAVGHSKEGGKCPTKGNDCYVYFGSGAVRANSYALYVEAISTVVEGLVAFIVMGVADYSNYRKWVMIGSIFIFGAIALPFAGLTGQNYSTLRGISALYALLKVENAVYQIVENSYIPLFMRAGDVDEVDSEEVRQKGVWTRGTTVSVMGVFLGNCGGITALLIGIIVSYSRNGTGPEGYFNFLYAISAAGALTVIFAVISAFFIPNFQGKKKNKHDWLIVLTVKSSLGLVADTKKFPQLFLCCLGWLLWQVSYTNFTSVYNLLFRTQLGLGSSDPEFTVFSFMSYILQTIGPLV